MPRATKGVLIECDPTVKQIILNLDNQTHDIVLEDLDERLLVHSQQLDRIRLELDRVLEENSFNSLPAFS
ncbi:hypothetical protein T552_02020 [Pneumocystis carinii B80]|uniref:General transcription and DNA repair factor IIH subunit TFB5 n=2 Tax=Pneumocystis TaxID=4753 RepID=M7NLZ1_PNEMU|nr:hypothetical protein PNEG_01875 [Pneumocystis murina B123]XP_018225870.1 hypothetical protein T552_02020 [Pneumocystis carinii B80]EMR09688.1 hypothetical protein PNEG_01875 [Pneumocystis murina B123]KTW28161.1 hypothetical protein T552_02020 [Pneumocystis carinii B80]